MARLVVNRVEVEYCKRQSGKAGLMEGSSELGTRRWIAFEWSSLSP